MKTFKEFQAESYSRIDENKAWLLRSVGGALGWSGADKGYDAAIDQSNKGLDLTKNKPRKGNNKVRTALNTAGSIIGSAPDVAWKIGKGTVNTIGKGFGLLHTLSKLNRGY